MYWILAIVLAAFFLAMVVIGLTRRPDAGGMTDAEVVKKNAESFCFS